MPANGIDEDCNGTPDDEPVKCDTGLALGSADPFDGARAVDLCRKTTADATGKSKTWGVIEATYVKPDGSPETLGTSHGILSAFGVNAAREGERMLGLSTGTARQPTDPQYQSVAGYDKHYTSGTPAGYPREAQACPGVVTGAAHDGAGLRLKIRVPTNAKSFSFNENFFTFEFPLFICSEFNDYFVAILEPKVATLADGNIAFDQQNNPISVNNSLLQVCTPQTAGKKAFPCPLGGGSLAGTGFEGRPGLEEDPPHAATGWLKTTAPVIPGTVITLLFTTWDSGDGVLDSSTLVDNFQWSVSPAGKPSTTPEPAPK